MAPLEFKAYAVHDTKKYNEFKVIDFTPKTLEADDVEISVHYCGVCASDVHTITGGWSEDIILPLITGHEVAGVVTRVGKNVTEFKEGDRAGVGAQAGSCMNCDRCKHDNENYCAKQVDTYNAKYENGEIAHGGYSSGIRVHQQFVFKVPDELELEQVAPMFCGGLTAFSPLYRHGCGPGKKVGIVGIGGLGHYCLQWARALGADEVVAISHSDSKKEDAMKMGATKFVVHSGQGKGLKDEISDLDLIVSTVDVAGGIPLVDLLSAVNVQGRVIMVGIPDDPLPQMAPTDFAPNGAMLGFTHIGSKKECYKMLELAVKHNVKTYVIPYPMKDAGKAVTALHEGDGSVRYRQVLKQDLVTPAPERK